MPVPLEKPHSKSGMQSLLSGVRNHVTPGASGSPHMSYLLRMGGGPLVLASVRALLFIARGPEDPCSREEAETLMPWFLPLRSSC